MNISKIYLWTDSQVTLAWIKTHPSKWKDFVRNRVTQIQELTTNAHWRYVPGAANPADCASRGISTTQLDQHSLWWTGSPWLKKPQESWPSQSTRNPDELCVQESRTGISMHSSVKTQDYQWDLIYKYSSLNKLLRITALVLKFISMLRKRDHSIINQNITSSHIEYSTLFWVRTTQTVFFQDELKLLKSDTQFPTNHPFSRLTAFIDDKGIIRVGGRLQHSSLPYENKHPAIMPRHSKLSELIIDQAHEKTLHGGTQSTLHYIRQQYWIIGGRTPVKLKILRCVICARQRGLRAQQLMGQLSVARGTQSRAFSHTGIDYAGPITLKTWKGRGAKTHKGWICIFLCMTTSAVHLEVVSDYSTEGFMATYRRFVSRREIPNTIYSDCGTNFLGADTQLRKIFKQNTHQNKSIAAMFLGDKTQWNFNPPAAPHMGGKWEAVVKSIKFHLRRTVKDTLLTFEESTTLLNQIEAILNSRPLEPLSDDPDDLLVITPGHFLIGSALNAVPEASLLDLSFTHLNRWQLLQQHVQSFWKQWSTQYLQRLQAISK